MDEKIVAVAKACAEGVDNGTMTIPQISRMLAEAGVERVLTDNCRGAQIYYTPEGESLELPAPSRRNPVAWEFDLATIKALIDEGRKAVTEDGGLEAGFSYKNLFTKFGAAGLAGSMISFSGRYTVLFGRTGEAHVEPFPPLK